MSRSFDETRWEAEWDDEPVGTTYHSAQRRWARWWNNYAVVLLCLGAAILVVPALGMFSWVRLLGAGCVLAAAGAVLQADRRAGGSTGGSLGGSLGRELAWTVAAVALAAGGVLVFASS